MGSQTDLQPEDGQSPDHVSVDETVIQLSDEQYWLYAAVDPQANKLLHTKLRPATTEVLAHSFLTELTEKHDVNDTVFLIDGYKFITNCVSSTQLRFQRQEHGNRDAVERIFRELNRRTSSFSNCFSHAEPKTAENWLQSVARWHNAPG